MTATSTRATAMDERRSPTLEIAVPGFDAFDYRSGIGRVVTSLHREWAERVRILPATFSSSRLPILRNVPRGIDLPGTTDVVLLPQITGAAGLRGVPSVPSLVIVHDVGVIDAEADRRGMDWLTRRSVLTSFRGLRYASRITAVSQFTADRLARYLPEVADRIVVIHNGVDERFLAYRSSKAAARQAIEHLLPQPLSEPTILYVGSEQPRKNISTILEAFRRLQTIYPTAQLLKVGRPGHPRWRAATMARAAESGLRVGTDLIFLEDIDDDDLAHTYRAADLFVSASNYEGFGLPVLEAMAVGTPVVVSDCGAHPEVTAGHGWLARPDPEAFHVAMLAALVDTEQEARTVRAMHHAATMTWRRAAARYLEELQRLSKP